MTVPQSDRNRPRKFQPYIYKLFGDLAVWWTPFRMGQFALQFPDFTYISPQVWQISAVKLCMPMPSHLQGV